MQALVIGQGSIGERHARLLAEEGCDVAAVTRRIDIDLPTFRTVDEAVVQFEPEYVVVANRTIDHAPAIQQLADAEYEGIVLVEKPLFAEAKEWSYTQFAHTFVAYNLRFHPGVQQLRDELEGSTVWSIQAYAGQYLPHWRPNRDYRATYSSSEEEGGGVLRDLSHEIDYLNWMLGGWSQVIALGGHLSTLDITSDDVAAILAKFDRCPAATINLNYLDRPGYREIIANAEGKTIRLNLTEGYIDAEGERTFCSVERDYTYRAQHRAILNGNHEDVCSAEEGLDVLQFVDAAETSVKQEAWVRR